MRGLNKNLSHLNRGLKMVFCTVCEWSW